ncbi:MAG TPA: hypothetical protein VN706_14200 [Gemmatimonadaceae bacterium]|nr:hypothetical protein [Gemmatimonadaceae bacterium]
MIDHTLRCDDVADRGLVERYAAGRLRSGETAAFEEHLLDCARCQEALELALAVRHAIGFDDTKTAPHRVRVRAPLLALAAASIVFAIVAVSLTKRSRADTHGVAGPSAAVLPEDAPLYLGAPVRESPTAADSVFADAMSNYTASHYAAAAEELSKVISADKGAEPALFFRGASYLMLGRAREARVDFTRVLAAGDNVYAAEAHYYRARAELQMGDTAAARADAGAVPSNDERVGQRARKLLDALGGDERRSR